MFPSGEIGFLESRRVDPWFSWGNGKGYCIGDGVDGLGSVLESGFFDTRNRNLLPLKSSNVCRTRLSDGLTTVQHGQATTTWESENMIMMLFSTLVPPLFF